jgi:hypothetical protein
MKKITVRLASPDESGKIIEWATPHVESWDKASYPTMRILCAENGKPIQYALTHCVAVLESLAPDPQATPEQLALSLKKITQSIEESALRVGIKEIIAMTGPDDEGLENLAERHGWEELPYRVWRKKI